MWGSLFRSVRRGVKLTTVKPTLTPKGKPKQPGSRPRRRKS